MDNILNVNKENHTTYVFSQQTVTIRPKSHKSACYHYEIKI